MTPKAAGSPVSEPSFIRNLGLFDATMIGVGAMIGAGIFGEVADQVIRNSPCDLVMLKIEKPERPKRCLFPTTGGPHNRLATEVLNVLAPALGMSVTACYVVPPNASRAELVEAEIRLGKTLESLEYDLVVLGSTRDRFIRQVIFGEIPEKVARYSPASVLVLRRYEGRIRSLLKRAFG